jgi:dolichyl-phosphate beta-glucosyltransferase
VGAVPTPRWSPVIPAYNEALRLPGYLKEIQPHFEGRDESYEVIVVDDGSSDGTSERVREVAAGRPAVVVHALERVLADPAVIRQVRLHRELSGHVFNFLVRRLGVASVVDTQCGFKLFRGPVADALFPDVTTDGFGFDLELLMLAERRGFRIVEVPINWADQPGSKVGVLREGPRMIYEVLAARRRFAGLAPGRRGA